MITLKENQPNTIAFQKENDTPLVTSSYDASSVYNIIIYPTLQNNTLLSSITYTNDTDPTNPRWTTLTTNLSSGSVYNNNQLAAKGGTTYNLEVWYGAESGVNDFIWKNNENTWAEETRLWASPSSGSADVNYDGITANSVLKYQDRVFISGSVQPNEKKYISSNEDGNYIVYTG